MKCPRCGTYNKSNAQACFRCGYAFAAPQGRKPSSQEMWKKKANPSPQSTDDPLLVLDDETQGVYADPDLADLGKNNAQKLADLQDQQTVRVVVPPRPVKTRHTNWTRFIASLILILVLLGGAGYGVYLGIGWISDRLSQWQLQEELSTLPQEPLVERTMQDGKSWHKITFYGEDGQRILVSNPRKSLAIHDGKAELLLADESYIPDQPDPDQAVIQVQLEATLFTQSGEELPIHVPAYEIEIPQAPLSIITPSETKLTTQETRILITLRVSTGSRVIIAGKNVTDNVNSNGVVTTSVDLPETGINTIEISVESRGYRKNTATLEVERPVMEVPIVINANVKSSTSDSAVTIEGYMQEGATISTTATLSEGESIIQDPVAGTFSFNAKLLRYGWNRIEITATTSDGKSSTLVYQVNREANLDTYTRQAWVMDYALIMTDSQNLTGASRVYLCEGYVVQKLDNDEGRNLYEFDVSEAENGSQIIILEYDGSSDLVEGRHYRAYADVTGTYNAYPVLAGRFVYNNEAQATPSPSASLQPTATPGQ